MSHIVELQHRLSQNRMEANTTANEEESNHSKVRARIASRNKDIDTLWKEGSSPYLISGILGILLTLLKHESQNWKGTKKTGGDLCIL